MNLNPSVGNPMTADIPWYISCLRLAAFVHIYVCMQGAVHVSQTTLVCQGDRPSCLSVTHTHTLVLALVLVFTTAAINWLRGPHNFGGEPGGGNKTSDTIGCRDTSLVSPPAWPPQWRRGTHLWACKTHEMRKVGYDHMSDSIKSIEPWMRACTHTHTHNNSFLCIREGIELCRALCKGLNLMSLLHQTHPSDLTQIACGCSIHVM